MRVVTKESVEEVVWQTPRGEIKTRRMLEGQENSVDNFVLQYHHSVQPFSTPRHRHNFEQVRLHLRGVEKYLEGEFGPGIVGYFPEATYYGPHSDDGDTIFAVLQWGGDPAYVSARQLAVAKEALEKKKGGVFEKGFYSWIDESGKKQTIDGWVALWEEHYKKKAEWLNDKSPYERPIFMNPDNHAWVPVEGARGVSRKDLGEFNNRRTRLSCLLLEPQAEFTLEGPMVGIVRSGSGTVDGQKCVQETAIRLESGEKATIKASEKLELFAVRMGRNPKYANLK